ncbi:hypothetical protein BGX28_008855 [Mortierella sp. GBA30]|nr:hypothetical protein BGX28_008855 [Mortierella sp. GBA30]
MQRLNDSPLTHTALALLRSPIDIPLIVNAICDSPDFDDIISCKRVCKDWSNVFATNEWRSIRLTDHNVNRIWSRPTSETRSLMVKNAHRIEYGSQSDLLATRHNPKEQGCFEVDTAKVGIRLTPLTLITALQGLPNLTELRLGLGFRCLKMGGQT